MARSISPAAYPSRVSATATSAPGPRGQDGVFDLDRSEEPNSLQLASEPDGGGADLEEGRCVGHVEEGFEVAVQRGEEAGAVHVLGEPRISPGCLHRLLSCRRCLVNILVGNAAGIPGIIRTRNEPTP